MSGVDIDDMKERMGIAVSALDSWYFGDDLAKETLLSHFHVQSLEGLGLMDYDCGVIASGTFASFLFITSAISIGDISSRFHVPTFLVSVVSSLSREIYDH